MSLRIAIFTVLPMATGQRSARMPPRARRRPCRRSRSPRSTYPTATSPSAAVRRPRPTRRSSTCRSPFPSSRRDLIQDQSMQSLADVARYVPGAGMAQGEGNRDTIILRGNSSTSDFFVDGVRDDVRVLPRPLQHRPRRDPEGPERHDLRPRRRRRRREPRDAPGELASRCARSSLQGGSWDNRRASVDVGDAVERPRRRCASRASTRIPTATATASISSAWGINPTFALGHRRRHGRAALLRVLRLRPHRGPRHPVELDGGRYVTDPSDVLRRPGSQPDLRDGQPGLGRASTTPSATDVRCATARVYADYDKFYQNVFAGGAGESGTGLVPLSAYNNEQLRKNIFNQTDLTFSFETGSIGHEFLVGIELGEQETDNFRMTGLLQRTRTLPSSVPASDPTVVGAGDFPPSATDADNHGRATIAALYVPGPDPVLAATGWRCSACATTASTWTSRTAAARASESATSDDLSRRARADLQARGGHVSLYASYSMTYVPRSGAQLASLNTDERGLRSGGVREHRARREVGRHRRGLP